MSPACDDQPAAAVAPLNAVATAQWNCPTCNVTIGTPHCPVCGERLPSAHDLSLRGLLHHLFTAFTSIDSRLIRSFKMLLSRPGALTQAFVRGQRKPYVGPLELFIVANVIFFATQSLTKVNILSATLDAHLNNEKWSATAQALVAARLASAHTTVEHYAPVFDMAIVVYAKSLIFLMTLPFSLLLPLLFLRRRQPFAAHVVFSLHFHSFVLLLFCLSLLLVAANEFFGGDGVNSLAIASVVNIGNLLVCAGYLFFATRVAYGSRGILQVLKIPLLALAVGGIFEGYRFVVFLITLYSTT
ncbi:MAG: DUF3667 domain-containing protein [Steroidobacteraceae bacterium]